MSYIQIEMGGKVRGLKFNQMANLIFAQKAVADNAIACTYALVWAGLSACSYAKDEVKDYTFENVCDWCDGLKLEDAEKITTAFQETELYKAGAQFIKDQEDAKKKETPTEVLNSIEPIA